MIDNILFISKALNNMLPPQFCYNIHHYSTTSSVKGHLHKKSFRTNNFGKFYMVFTTEGLFEVAIESWPEWDLNPRPLNSIQTL